MANYFVLNILKSIAFLPIWWYDGLKKRDSKTWVFGAWYGENYSDNCRNLFEYVSRCHPEINAVWITRSDSVYSSLKSKNMNVEYADSKEGISICKKAKYAFISNTLRDINEKHVNGMTRVWLWHGHPLKKIVYDQPAPAKTIKEKIRGFFPPCSKPKADIVLNASPFFSPFYQTAFRVTSEQIIDTGYPRNDSFFENGTAPYIEGLRQKYPNSRIIMYMPTFRDTLYKDGKAFNPFGSFGFDIISFNGFLERNNLVFLYKGHYVDIQNQTFTENDGSRFVFVNSSMYDNLYSFIKDTDILATDYSSIYFDYLLLKKPIILTPFDKNSYCNGSRPLYFSYDDNIEGVKANDWDEFMRIVEDKQYYVPSQNTLNKYHLYQDGNSSQRVTEYFLNLK